MRRALAFTAIMLAASSCTRKQPVTIEMRATYVGPAFEYRLSVEGHEMGPFRGTHTFDVVEKDVNAKDPQANMPSVSAKVRFLCGWEEATVKIAPPKPEEFSYARKNPASKPAAYVTIDWEPGRVGTVGVDVDNRGGSEDAVFRVAEEEKTVPARGTDRLTFTLWPHCDAARHLKLNGKDLAELPASADQRVDYLVDVTASNCYKRKVTYFTIGGQPGPPAKSTLLNARKIRVLAPDEHYVDFLHESPSQVEVPLGQTTAMRTALLDAPCR